MADVRFEQATRIYDGTDVPAVDALDLAISDGEFLVFVGPSGSGKTTALRMLAGLEPVDAGTIWIGERDVTDVPPKQRDVASGLPELRPLSLPHGRREHRIPLARRPCAEGETCRARA